MRNSRRRLFMLISLLAVLSMLLVACNGDDDEPDDVGDEAPVPTVTPAEDDEATATPADDDEATATPADDDEATATPADDDEATPDTDAPTGDAAAGEELWESQCMACHTIDGSQGIGPTWQGLWMSEVPLEDGSTVTADEAYITESIVEPNAKIHEGFQPAMPAFDLSDDEIANLIAFIQTLE